MDSKVNERVGRSSVQQIVRRDKTKFITDMECLNRFFNAHTATQGTLVDVNIQRCDGRIWTVQTRAVHGCHIVQHHKHHQFG